MITKNIILIVIMLFNSISFAESLDSEDFPQFQSVRIDVTAGSSNLDVLNKNTKVRQKLDSSKNIKLDLKFIQHWSENNRSYLGFDFNDLAYKDSLGNTSSSGGLISAKIGHIHNPIKRLSFNIELLSYSFIVADTAASVNLVAKTTPAARAAYAFDLYHSDSTRLGFGQSILGGDKVLEYDASIYARKIYRKFSIEVNFTVDKGSWESELTKTSFENNMIGTKISIPFR